jgi:peptidoglycan hydrolase-like protein with peptidoglycan-binding domain
MTANTTTQSTTSKTSPKTSRRLVAAIVAGGVAIAGLTAVVTMTLESPTAHAQTTSASSSSSSGTTTHHGSSTHGGQHHSHHAVTPSESIKTLQSQLAQLNYYDGASTGHMNAGTIHAIEHLQRSAGLPQTGSMTSATQTALDYQLAHGDNQRGN